MSIDEVRSENSDTLAVFWHHVGREHGENVGYASDLRKNTPEVVQAYLSAKMRGARDSARTGRGNRFVRADENVILELPRDMANSSPLPQHPFVICYLIAEGLQLSLGNKPRHPGWLIDMVQITEIEPDLFCAADLFVDIQVAADGKSYRVLDADDLQFAISTGIINTATVNQVIRSLATALDWLNPEQEAQGTFPPPRIQSLVSEHAPYLLRKPI